MFTALSLFLVLFSSLFFNSVTSQAHEGNLTEDNKAIVFTAPDMDLTLLTEEDKEILLNIGWNLDADIPYLIEGDFHTIEEDSEVLTANSLQDHSDIEYIHLGELFDSMENLDNLTSSNPQGDYTLTSVHQPIFSPPAHGTKVYSFGDMVHCNRFNGPNTDHRHYAKTHPRAYINFYGSDCATAVIDSVCSALSDDCNTSATYHRGWCSRQIGHNINYHPH